MKRLRRRKKNLCKGKVERSAPQKADYGRRGIQFRARRGGWMGLRKRQVDRTRTHKKARKRDRREIYYSRREVAEELPREDLGGCEVTGRKKTREGRAQE